MPDDDFDDLFIDPNGPAYQKPENRTGVPLDYVAEKLRASLESLHFLIGIIGNDLSDGLSPPGGLTASAYATKKDGLWMSSFVAFRSGITAFLALNNMLALANDQDLFERLLGYSHEEVKEWFDRIADHGSVTG